MNYKKTFATLAGATLFAQLISLLFIPLISRRFPPESFAEFTFWAAMGGLAGGILSLKQEQFFLSRPRTEWPTIVSRIIILYKAGTTLFSLAAACYLIFSEADKITLIILTFLYCLSTSLIISITNISNILEKFSALAKSRIIMAATLGSTQLALGIFSASPESLLIGAALSQLFFLAYLYRKAQIKSILTTNIRPTLPAINDIKISLNSIFSTITLSIATSFPPVAVFTLGYHVEAGILALLQRIMLMPVNLLAAPASQVLVVFLRKNQRKIRQQFFIRTAVLITLTYFLSYLLVLATSALNIFTYTLGEQWKAADLFAPSVVTVYVSLLIRNISVQYFVVRERQSSLMKIDVFFLVLLASGYSVAGNNYMGLQQYLLTVNITYFIYMLAPLVYILFHNSRDTSKC